jgi:thiol-disulfide isomerase/thioredoxin
MKNLITTLIVAFIAITFTSCGNSQTSESEQSDTTKTEYGIAKAEVFYFHATRRCPTCLKIEEVAKEVVESEYKDKDVRFYSINFDEETNKEISEKFNVSWSSLFISSGEQFEDLTDLAFQVATSDPDKLKEKMRSVIDIYLNQ